LDYRYRQDNGRFARVDGGIKTWELAQCLSEDFPDEASPLRCNVEFFIKIRNKVERRSSLLRSLARPRPISSTMRRR
jgi:hypothetical protein